jgi:O-antigen/teichoic acid export membrane protein
MNFYALVSIVEVFFNLGIVFMLAWSPLDKLISYSLLLFVVAIIITTFYVTYCYLIFKECRYIKYWDKNTLKQFMTYSGWSISVDMSDVATVQCMNIFFFNLLGPVSNAALSIASNITNALNRFLQTFTSAFKPQIIKNYAAGRNEVFMRMIYTSSKISYFLLLLMAVPIVANIHLVLGVWLGDYPEEAPSFVRMIIIYTLIDAFQLPLWAAVHATGDIRTHQFLMSIIKILAIPSIWLLLHYGGTGVGALAIWVALNFACAVVRIIFMHYHIHLDYRRYFNQVIFPIIVVSTIVVPIVYGIIFLCEQPILRFFISSPVSVFLIGICAYKFGLNKEERYILESLPIVRKLFSRGKVGDSRCYRYK